MAGAAWISLCFGSTLWAALPRTVVVIDAQAPPLERHAAEELKSILQRLYEVEVVIASDNQQRADAVFLLGQSTTNHKAAEMLSKDRTELSDQGIMLKTVPAQANTLVVRGGSPIATLWAVYELGERLGVRYLCDRDVYPTTKPVPWRPLPKLDVVMEPNLRVRCWRLLNEHAMGPISWSLEENRRFLRQIVKMKFNRVHLFVWPAQPFVDYTFRGIRKSPGVMFMGWRFPIDRDTIGRERFGSMTEFTNPEFLGVKSPDELHQRAVNLAQGIFRQAQELGLETDLSFFPTEWPKQFSEVVPNSQPYRQAGDLTCGPGPRLSVDDPVLRDMVTTVIRAHIEAYPDVDFIRLSLPEHAAWLTQAQACYDRLSERYDLSEIGTFDELCARARARESFPGGGARVEHWVKEGLATLYLVDQLVRERQLLKRPGGGPDILLSLKDVPDELFPLIAQQFPSGSEVVGFIDYTASRQLKQVESLRRLPPKDLARLLTITLADDNVGVLPQLATGSIHKLLGEMRSHDWSGYTIRYWLVGEQDPAIHYLARSSWQSALTPESAYADQISVVCGAESVAPAQRAFALVEDITQRLDQHGLGFGFPVPDMMQQHAGSGGLNQEIRQVQGLYREALASMQEAHERARPEGRFYMNYFVGRLRFAVRYLEACDKFGKATAMKKSGERQAASQHADAAEQAIREAIESIMPMIRDHGELGLVAVLNEFCYKPIRQTALSLAKTQ